MDVNCEGCAGCCIDWRPVGPDSVDHERRGPRRPIDDTHNFVSLTRDEVRGYVGRGLGDALTPRLWHAGDDDDSVEIDGVELAAIGDRPVFFVGLRKPPKPVAPFGIDPTWLETCVFLDPDTLKCRVHGGEDYPETCADYPGHNLALGRETECERVGAAYGGDRLLDADPPEGMRGPLLGPHAIGGRVFVHPDPDELGGLIERIAAGSPTDEDRAAFVGVAAGSSPGMLAVNEERAGTAREAVLAADSWTGRAAADWTDAAGEAGSRAADPPDADAVETDRGAPATEEW